MLFWIFKESFQINTLLWLLPILAVWKIKKAEEYRSSAKHFIACFFQKNRFSSLSNPCGIRHDMLFHIHTDRNDTSGRRSCCSGSACL